MPTVLVRGSGDVASAVAHALFGAGYAVCLHDSPLSSATRRKMAFTDAIFDGEAVLDGLTARRVDTPADALVALTGRNFIPIFTGDFDALLTALRPAILVDARMRKHARPEPQIHLAPRTLGLGPGFVAGENVHAAVETSWGESLGQALWQGATRPLEGEPRAIDGRARERYLYSPLDGVFTSSCAIGDWVESGQKVAQVGDAPLFAPIAGYLRGLTRPGVPVQVKTKVLEIDPRREGAQVTGIAERPARIAAGVLQAVQRP